MVIFHSYVSLPEGISHKQKTRNMPMCNGWVFHAVITPLFKRTVTKHQSSAVDLAQSPRGIFPDHVSSNDPSVLRKQHV